MTFHVEPHGVNGVAAELHSKPLEDALDVAEKVRILPLFLPLGVDACERIMDDVLGGTFEVEVLHEESEELDRFGVG